MADGEKLSLYHAVAEGGYEAAVLATYAINFPFYERVVLRRLQAARCRHNILIADGGQCGRELESAQTGPQFCGSDYLLLPVRSAASFHPKFVMLVGKRGAKRQPLGIGKLGFGSVSNHRRLVQLQVRVCVLHPGSQRKLLLHAPHPAVELLRALGSREEGVKNGIHFLL